MEQREREVIDGLFAKLRQVELQAPQRDRDAEQHIRQQVTGLPSAPYYMAQTILVQEQALGNLQGRVQELERQLAARPAAGGGGGFLSGLFGGGQPAETPRRPMTPAQAHTHAQAQAPMMQPGMGAPGYGSPWRRPAGGGGFLAGAMQTAVGVAGGMLVADAIMGAFDGGTDAAADLASEAGLGGGVEEPAPDAAQDAGYEQDMSEADMGGDFGEEI